MANQGCSVQAQQGSMASKPGGGGTHFWGYVEIISQSYTHRNTYLYMRSHETIMQQTATICINPRSTHNLIALARLMLLMFLAFPNFLPVMLVFVLFRNALYFYFVFFCEEKFFIIMTKCEWRNFTSTATHKIMAIP